MQMQICLVRASSSALCFPDTEIQAQADSGAPSVTHPGRELHRDY